MVIGLNVFFENRMYIDVAKEIEKLKSPWHEKGKEIENEFKRLYKLPQPAPKLKDAVLSQRQLQLAYEQCVQVQSDLLRVFLIEVYLSEGI